MEETNVSSPEIKQEPVLVKETPKPSNGNGFLISLLSILLLISVAMAGFFAYQTQNLVSEINSLKKEDVILVSPKSSPTSESSPSATSSSTPLSSPTNSVACTLEAKICPDGSYVGRTGPKCEFSACPTASPQP